MRVILQQEVTNLGKVGDQVTVKAGYGRNYLLPQGMAVLATEKNITDFEARRAELEKMAEKILADSKNRAEKLTELEIIISAQAGDEGKLFGSIGPRDIAIAITEKGINVEKKRSINARSPIRQVGEFTISLKLHMKLRFQLKSKLLAKLAIKLYYLGSDGHDIFKNRQGIAGNHSRVLSDYAFPFFSRKNEKKREIFRLPPAPLVLRLDSLENIGFANALIFRKGTFY